MLFVALCLLSADFAVDLLLYLLLCCSGCLWFVGLRYFACLVVSLFVVLVIAWCVLLSFGFVFVAACFVVFSSVGV